MDKNYLITAAIVIFIIAALWLRRYKQKSREKGEAMIDEMMAKKDFAGLRKIYGKYAIIWSVIAVIAI